MNKKWLVRGAVVLGILMAALLVTAPAMACWDWCGCDPTLNIGGHTVSLQASIQGPTQEILGNIKFTVSMPKDTDVSVISVDPGAQVLINRSQNAGDPVEISLDIHTKATYNTMLFVIVDGQQVAQLQGTTASDLDYYLTLP